MKYDFVCIKIILVCPDVGPQSGVLAQYPNIIFFLTYLLILAFVSYESHMKLSFNRDESCLYFRYKEYLLSLKHLLYVLVKV